MKIIRRFEFDMLLQTKHVPCVSLYLRVHPANREGLNDALRLRQLLDDAKTQLLLRGWDQEILEKMLAPAYALPLSALWSNRQQMLALFISPGVLREYMLDSEVAEESWGDDRFHVRPLLPLVLDTDEFYLLALSEHQVQLYSGDSQNFQLCEVPQLPQNMAQVLDIESADRGAQVHSGGQASYGRAAAVHHGQGGMADTAHANMEAFVHRVAGAVDHYLNAQQTPLVLMAVERLSAIWLNHCHYTQLVQPAIHGNPDHVSLAELHAQGWQAAQESLRAAQRASWERCLEVQATLRSAAGLHQVLTAAHAGKVDSVFLDCHRPVWGKFHRDTSTAHIHHQPQLGDHDLIEETLAVVQQHAGHVYAYPADSGEPQELAVASLRY